jgi:cytochrome bd-type quinol oxidase subunit 2
MSAKKTKDNILFVMLILFLLFFVFGSLIFPELFGGNPLLEYIFGWDCLSDNPFMEVFCQFFFVLKIVVIIYLIYVLLAFLKKKM